MIRTLPSERDNWSGRKRRQEVGGEEERQKTKSGTGLRVVTQTNQTDIEVSEKD